MLSKKAEAMRARKAKTKEPPAKACVECCQMCHSAVRMCPSCGYEFYAVRLPKGSRTMRWTGGV